MPDPIRYKVTANEPSESLEFVMSDDSVDRVGDIIEADGWQLARFRRNPVALFGHDSSFPIGTWSDVRVEGNKLVGKLKLAAKGTSQRIDELISLVEQRVLRAVSVGFQPIKAEPIDPDEPWEGLRFIKQELLETSLVSVPANPNALQRCKALNISDETMALVFGEHASRTRAMVTTNGGHASSPTLERPRAMKPISQRIQDAQVELNAKKDRLQELTGAETIDTAAINEVNAQIEIIEEGIKALKLAERNLSVDAMQPTTIPAMPMITVQAQTPQAPQVMRRPLGFPLREPKPGELVLRTIVAKVLAHHLKKPVLDCLVQAYGIGGELDAQTRAVFDMVTRTAVIPADTTTSGWASQLVETQIADFMGLLIPASVYPGLSGRGLRLNFGRSGIISIPSRVSTPTIAGAFVLQGNPIPVKQGAFTAVTLTPKKMAVISTFTREIGEHSIPAIEGLIMDAMREDTSVTLDSVLLGSAAADTATPAGIRNGVSVTTATAGGGFAALVGDIKALLGALITATNGNLRNPVWIMNPIQAVAIALTQNAGGDFPFKQEINNNTLQGYPLIQSANVTAGMVILVDAGDFVSVEGDAPRFDVSDTATLHMETAPSAIGTVGTPNVVAAPVRSLWQTDTLGIRMLMDVNWALRRTGVVAWTQAVTW